MISHTSLTLFSVIVICSFLFLVWDIFKVLPFFYISKCFVKSFPLYFCFTYWTLTSNISLGFFFNVSLLAEFLYYVIHEIFLNLHIWFFKFLSNPTVILSNSFSGIASMYSSSQSSIEALLCFFEASYCHLYPYFCTLMFAFMDLGKYLLISPLNLLYEMCFYGHWNACCFNIHPGLCFGFSK